MTKFSLYLMFIAAFLGYSVVVYTTGTQAPSTMEAFGSTEQEGKRLWNSHNCIACHQLYGLGGYMGPDLTNVVSNKGPVFAQAIISSGAGRMPNFQFTEAEAEALVAFLKVVDRSGTSPPSTFETTWYGTVKSYKRGE